MCKSSNENTGKGMSRLAVAVLGVVIAALVYPFNLFSTSLADGVAEGGDNSPIGLPLDTLYLPSDSVTAWEDRAALAVGDSLVNEVVGDSLVSLADSILLAHKNREVPEWEEREVEFNPDPTRAVWLGALFPGLGQIYNRRYWKLPIVVGGFLGLGYATNWNNTMLKDYTRAYSDIMDNDPSSKSYMDFFPSTTKEEDLDKTWLTNILKSRKDYYRRNRDLCIICMVALYLVAMVDAYVDASLAHFDISPDLSVDWAPAVMQDGRNKYPSLGLQWAINF
ncbi:MAG: DUF5683 domain-containing protein [Bacteroidales bacterium]|nr:DUF5683 domain-containing protein [Bacteroidales bacterium]MCD8395364.1 DUF5683 domain-containing protein [Bacteroidales bacterium]